MKTCRTCKAEKPPRAFYRAGPGRRRTECRDCTRASVREDYRLKREVIRERAKRYRESAHGRRVIRAYRQSAHGRQRQQESQRFWRGTQKLNTPRVSRGLISPGKVMTDRGVRRPVAISIASSSRTRPITGAACGAETRYHERRADLHGVTGNAGAMGRGPISP